jgi:hypothetical protein
MRRDPDPPPRSAEHARLEAEARGEQRWKRWGPYLSERQWGTVREDYSPHGTAWSYLPHDAARSRAYRWGEDGIAGISDDQQRLCLALALWNGRDPILKERLFGLTNEEGNHGEDVKEIYYYLDATPTHSYLRMLYKYPQRAFPYAQLVEENRRRGRDQPEYELIDTGALDGDRYFDVVIEHAKAAPADLLMAVTVHNRGPEAALIDVIPQLWFRNTWSWRAGAARPVVRRAGAVAAAVAEHARLGRYHLACEADAELLFCDNDTNPALFGAAAPRGYFKDALHRYIIGGDREAVCPDQSGTKVGARCRREVPAGASITVRARLWAEEPGAPAGGPGGPAGDPFADFAEIVEARRREADAYYDVLQAGLDDPDARRVQRQAFAGMIWSKQLYYYDVPLWLAGDPAQPAPPPERRAGRNSEWSHLNNADILSMPDKWEYPWYAAWDLAFHCIPLAHLDAELAKAQLVLLTREWYMHPNGQLPAYEWALGDANPPVHAWAAWKVFEIDRAQRGGRGDHAFLERVLHKLMLNFTWWVNRKDAEGKNVFQGGFLGLDNIGVFDRSAPLPTGGHLDQADGTSWMAMYCLDLLRIALELAQTNPVYQDIATKFFEHFLYIAAAMNNVGGRGIPLWDEADEFYYDVLHACDRIVPLKIRSIVGLIPLFAVETLEPELLERVPEFRRRLRWMLRYAPHLAALVSRWEEPGRGDRRLLSLLRGHRMKRLLRRMLDEAEFLSPYGVRSLSRHHERHPYVFELDGARMEVSYQPAESTTGVFGGNSNWRGPIWLPINYLIIDALRRFHGYYGDEFRVECPTGSGQLRSLAEIADELAARLVRIFLRDGRGERPVAGAHPVLARDPRFRDLIAFHEYFHGDTGRGLGASHQTGWTGLIACLLQPRGAGGGA